MTDQDTFQGWACVDCLMLLANGETDPELSETETAGYLANVEAQCAGTEVTLGMFRELHECATNVTVTDTAGQTYDYRADNENDARDAHELHAGTDITSIEFRELATVQDRGGECDCEQVSFSWSACDVCGSNLGGERHAVTFWILPETAKSN